MLFKRMDVMLDKRTFLTSFPHRIHVCRFKKGHDQNKKSGCLLEREEDKNEFILAS